MAVPLVPILFGVGAAAGGAAGLYGAKKKGRQVRKQSRFLQRSINENVNRSRVALVDETDIASRRTRSIIADYAASRINSEYVSGHSIDRVIAAMSADAEIDQFNREKRQEQFEEAAMIQKQNVANQAVSPNEALAAITGGIEGGQIGASLGSSIQNYQAAASRQQAFETYGPLAAEGDRVAQAKLAALMDGVPPSMLRGDSTGVIQPYLDRQELLSLQLIGAQRAAGYEYQQLNELKRGYSDSLRRQEALRQSISRNPYLKGGF